MRSVVLGRGECTDSRSGSWGIVRPITGRTIRKQLRVDFVLLQNGSGEGGCSVLIPRWLGRGEEAIDLMKLRGGRLAVST